MQKLNDIPYDKLKSSFKIEFKQLKDKIYRQTLPKRINGKRLTGPVMANLIVEFVNTINSGAIPNINNSWDSVINKDIKEYYEKALNKFKMNIKRLKDLQEQEDIIRLLYSFKIESMLIYDKLYYINQETFCNQEYMNMYQETKARLEKEIKTIEDKAIIQNSDNCCSFCKDLLKTLYKGVKKNLFRLIKNFLIIFIKIKQLRILLQILMNYSKDIEIRAKDR